ncbi:MAG: hypothetical protein O4806_15570, partial [Trichodesmium sp. St5_bin8]|nr:hypothetical protein [Trichodesmium sp. St5_bin8]
QGRFDFSQTVATFGVVLDWPTRPFKVSECLRATYQKILLVFISAFKCEVLIDLKAYLALLSTEGVST